MAGLVNVVSTMQDARATSTPAPGDAAAAVAEGTAAATPPSSTAIPAATPAAGTPPAATPPATAVSPAPTSESAAAATTPDPGTAATPGTGDAETPEQKRVKDAQARMHEATTETAAVKGELEQALAENRELKGKLTAIVVDPTLVEITLPAGLPTDDTFKAELDAALTEYQTPQEGVTDSEAFRAYELRKVDILRRWDDADRTRKSVVRENARRSMAAQGSIKSSINLFVSSLEPDLPLDWFWAEAKKPEIVNAVPAEITDPVERLEYQAKVTLQRCRALLNGVRAKAATAGAQTENVSRAAGVVMPGGTSTAPPASAAAPQPGQRKTLTDMVAALPAQAPGARR